MQIQSLSSVSSTMSKSIQRDVKISYQINSMAPPKTLKFISNLILFILIIMILTSVTTVFLTLSNFKDAQLGILISQFSFQRFSGISRARLMLRTLININSGLADNGNSMFSNRTRIYQNTFEQSMEDLRLIQNSMKIYTFPGDDLYHSCKLDLLLPNLSQSILPSNFD